MNSNRKEVREQVKKHILESVYDENGDEFDTFKEAAQHVAAEFDRVANHPYNVKRLPNQQERFQDFMQGLPFHFEYTYHNQRKIVAKWLQSENPEEYTDSEVAKRYYYMIYKEINKFIH